MEKGKKKKLSTDTQIVPVSSHSKIKEKHHKKDTHHHKNSVDSDGGTGSVIAKRSHKKNSNLINEKKYRNRESMKYVGMPLEWNSEVVRTTPLHSDDYKACIVLVMEESSELTEFTAALTHAIALGSRKKYISITASEIESKVKQYMTSANLRNGSDDMSYLERIDLWSEAIKSNLLKLKAEAMTEMEKEVEKAVITGARSKDQMQFIPPIMDNDSQTPKMLPGTEQQSKSSKQKGPAVEGVDKMKKKKDSKVKSHSTEISPEETVVLKNALHQQRGSSVSGSVPIPEAPVRKPTFLKRRSAFAPQMFELKDDAPKEGPDVYVVLVGFYNPHILDELKAVGVQVDSVLLLTRDPVTKHNFSLMDIEEKIIGLLPLQNTLPEYADMVKSLFEKRKTELDIVSSFWFSFADLIKTAPSDSYIHDIALLNCELPKMEKEQLTPEERGVYGSFVFETVSKIIYNMLHLKQWFLSYNFSFQATEIPEADPEIEHYEYDCLISQIPSECHTVSILMDCLLQQVLVDLGENPNETDSSQVHIVSGLTNGNNESEEAEAVVSPTSSIPTFLNNFDFGTMRACHLNNNFAARLAATQINKDFTMIQNFLWTNIPNTYDEDMKLQVFESISNFMYFLPPNALSLREMSYITHLLLAKGIDLKLQESKDESESKLQIDGYSSDYEILGEQENSKADLEVESLTEEGTRVGEEIGSNIPKPTISTAVTEDYFADSSDTDKGLQQQSAEETLDDLITQTAHILQSPMYQPITETSDPDWAECKPGSPRSYFSRLFLNPNYKCPTPPNSDCGFTESKAEQLQLDEEEGARKTLGSPPTKYNSSEQEFFNFVKEPSAIEKLVECPGLFPVGGNGRVGSFESSRWAENYLMILGLCGSDGERSQLGNLGDWNFMEEYRPTQMIQLLCRCLQKYLCFERVYVPYYDTLIFMFNNPSPASLISEAEFYTELKTRRGIQDFLEYTVNEPNVLEWLLNVQTARSADITDSFSATTLLRLIPNRQWILNPSIKHNLLERAKQEKLRSKLGLSLHTNFEVDEEETEEEFGQLKREKAAKRRSTRTTSPSVGTLNSKRISKTSTRATNKKKIPAKALDELEAKKASSAKLISSKPLVSSSGTDSSKTWSVSHLDHLSSSSSFNFSDAIRASKGIAPVKWSGVTDVIDPKFFGYDLGKRSVTVATNTAYLFPMDGTRISYEIHTLDPNIRMQQLCIESNGHSSYFYPYYLPHDMYSATEPYVLIPSFHLIHSNGIIFAFHDKRLFGTDDKKQENEYFEKWNEEKQGNIGVFDNEHVVFASDDWQIKFQESNTSLAPSDWKMRNLNTEDDRAQLQSQAGEDENEETQNRNRDLELDAKAKLKKARSNKKMKDSKSKERKIKEDKSSQKGITEKRSKKLKKKTKGRDEGGGEYRYSTAENTEDEDFEMWLKGTMEDEVPKQNSMDEKPNSAGYTYSWKNAIKLLDPMSHNFRVSLPSGLSVEVEDCFAEGEPLRRQIRQAYQAKSSGNLITEFSRYYLPNGSVVRFLLNKTIQVLNVRGVTTMIREIFADGARDEGDLLHSMLSSKNVKIFNGNVIHPSGEYWKFVQGRRKPHPPMEVFTSSPLPNGEVFTRRQDGLVYVHRADGTVITHYPDGTRFTSRMIILSQAPEEFNDWTFVGIKLMVENPHYATVLFNSLSGNVHIKMNQGGSWVRIFADGSVRVQSDDHYKLDVDKYRAILSNPPCKTGGKDKNPQTIPNIVAVKLWHSPEPSLHQTTMSGEDGSKTPLQKSKSKVNLTIGPISTNSKDFQTSDSIPKLEQTKTKQNLWPAYKHSVFDFLTLPENTARHHSVDFDSGFDPRLPHPPPNTVRPNFEIEDFMTFRDMFTFCKAIDSWDNRFELDIFGQKVVHKSESYIEKSFEDLVESISENFLIPKRFVSGILDTTSSENLLTKDKRINSFLTTTPLDSCEKTPKVEIYVLKRDLSGYQFLKKSTVDHIIKSAKSNPDSMITTNVNTSATNKKHRSITILEPISATGLPYGTWKSKYREPVFRPSKVFHIKPLETNSSLRWFANVLLTANLRRPSFLKSPKELYLIKREQERGKSTEKLSLVSGSGELGDLDQLPSRGHKSMSVRKSTMILQSDYEDEEEDDEENEDSEEEEMEMETREADVDAKSSVNLSKKHKKDKSKGKEGKLKKDKRSSETKSSKKGKLKDGGDGDPGKKPKSAKKGKGKKQDETQPPSPIDSRTQGRPKKSSGDPLSGGKSEETISKVPQVPYPFPRPRKDFRFIPFEDLEYKDYPPHIPDITDLYGIGETEDFSLRQEYHPDSAPCPKKAIVVRTIKEIPKLDHPLQRALLLASVSYNQSLRNENDQSEEIEGELWAEDTGIIEHEEQNSQESQDEVDSLTLPGKVRFSFVQHDDGPELLLSKQTN